MKRSAVIAIGSNSIRLLVADDNESLSNSYRAKRESRLFMSLEAGELTTEALHEATQAVKFLKEAALMQEAARIDLIATSAVRDASNSRLLYDAVKEETGLCLHIISGHEEAAYSFIGAAGPGLAGVIDIGGGSTEIATGENGHIISLASAQAGAARLYRQKPINAVNDIQEALEIARVELEEPIRTVLSAAQPEAWRITGGTGTTMSAVARGFSTDINNPEGFCATRRDVRDCLRYVASVPPEERSGITGLPKSRIDIFPTGLCLLFSAMELLDIEKVSVTIRGNTDGWLLSALRKNAATCPLANKSLE